MKDDADYFGVPEENIRAAQLRSTSTKHYLHSVVPTRREVATLPAPELKAMLLGWMEHSPIEIVPSRAQISLVREVLIARPDAAGLASVIKMCTHYIDNG